MPTPRERFRVSTSSVTSFLFYCDILKVVCIKKQNMSQELLPEFLNTFPWRYNFIWTGLSCITRPANRFQLTILQHCNLVSVQMHKVPQSKGETRKATNSHFFSFAHFLATEKPWSQEIQCYKIVHRLIIANVFLRQICRLIQLKCLVRCLTNTPLRHLELTIRQKLISVFG